MRSVNGDGDGAAADRFGVRTHAAERAGVRRRNSTHLPTGTYVHTYYLRAWALRHTGPTPRKEESLQRPIAVLQRIDIDN
jgi:hypothetical protein